MARLLIISFSPIASDPRVMRQVRALSGRHAVTVAGFGSAPAGTTDFVEVRASKRGALNKARRALRLLAGQYGREYWRSPAVVDALAKLQHRTFDVIIANDVDTLPLACCLAAGAPIVLDAHEYAPREHEDSWIWRIFLQRYTLWLCRTYLPNVRSAMTVGPGIAKEYMRQFSMPCEVVYNTPDPAQLPVRSTDQARVRLIHHGGALRSRHIERMIEMMSYLDERFTLDFMLVPSDPHYMKDLVNRASKNGRIAFRPPVPLAHIVSTLHEYDIGVYILPPVSFNSVHALPNKLFEFIQARLAVAIGPSPEMRRLTEAWKFGVVSADFQPESLAVALNALSSGQIDAMKHCAAAAAQQLHGGIVANQLVSIVEKALPT